MTLLETRIREKLKQKDILIMSHTVIGYPDLQTSYDLVDELVTAGVDMIELQFPFSEPIADGPVLLQANQMAVKAGITIDTCFEFANKITQRHPDTIFVIMTYYNIVFKRGVEQFITEAKKANVAGLIVPDLLPEQAGDLFEKSQLDLIFLVTPKTPNERLRLIAKKAKGMIYCVARVGVTGKQTIFSKEFDDYLARVKDATELPIGVGFGVRTKEDIEHLNGRADIAIICTKAIELCVGQGVKAVEEYFSGLR